MKLHQEYIDKANKVKYFIEKEYHRHYTYEYLAQLSGINKSTFQFAFKEATQKNPYEFLTSIRMEKAMELLMNSSSPIKQIAGKIGLDKSNFNKQFKKFTGQTPLSWKKKQKTECSKNNIENYTNNFSVL